MMVIERVRILERSSWTDWGDWGQSSGGVSRWRVNGRKVSWGCNGKRR
jgi:hypothetical protein